MDGEPSISQDLLAEDTNGTLRRIYHRFSSRTATRYCGRNRNVFDLGRYVVKLPINFGGISDNDLEGSLQNGSNRDDGISIQYPRARLVYIDRVPVLFMEKVEPIDFSVVLYADLPAWVSYVDCGQVGFTKLGRLVAYDYGKC